MTVTKSFQIKNELGIHARAAALLVQTSSRYRSRIVLEKDGIEVDGKSILGIMTLACPRGSVLSVTAEGDDAVEAIDDIGRLIENKFGERN
ncbi:MAG: HPr family phosphocarrier protein [Syntrophales bacterium]|nr:HPr family phosphocarrier protein [Syntrophales bacterium]MDD5532084.1 HPr family phosphocarrier protein [Syntrophales bacterium]HPL63357.1 HPr family phosphocarrier protein [Syntrophales bacterium]